MVADKEKWGTALTVVDIRTRSVKKSNGSVAEERRLYITDLKKDAKLLNDITRHHWMIESMHWSLDTGMRQDAIKRHTKRGGEEPRHNTAHGPRHHVVLEKQKEAFARQNRRLLRDHEKLFFELRPFIECHSPKIEKIAFS